MAYAKKCDRCQCFFEGSTTKNPDAKIELSINISEYGEDHNANPFFNYAMIGNYDLCPSCYVEFKKFLLIYDGIGVDKK